MYEPKTWRGAAWECLNELRSSRIGWNRLETVDPTVLYEQEAYGTLGAAALQTWLGGARHGDELANIDWLASFLEGKQRDYGPQNILRFASQGVLVRLWDKIARWNHLRGSGNIPQNETLHDTACDIVGYVVILMMLENGWFELPLDTVYDGADELLEALKSEAEPIRDGDIVTLRYVDSDRIGETLYRIAKV